MATEEPPLTRSDLREELDRTLRHYATKADLAALETRITAAMASQTRWLPDSCLRRQPLPPAW